MNFSAFANPNKHDNAYTMIESADTAVAFLAGLAERARRLRASHGVTRKTLARESGVSERYLAQLEGGRGNVSILLLRQIADALAAPLEDLIVPARDTGGDLAHAVGLLRRLSSEDLAAADRWLTRTYADDDTERGRRIALIGLKGAGKSTVGRRLAERLGVPFVELDDEISRTAGLTLPDLFDLYGQGGFRRLEREALDRVIAAHDAAVIAVGGGLVSDIAVFDRLLGACRTVWLKASPADHMARVVAQGDLRPMADNRQAMADLQHILDARSALYARADIEVSTTGKTVEESVEAVAGLIGSR